MMLKADSPRPSIFLLGFTVIAVLFGALLVLLQGPHHLSLLFIVPVLYAASCHTRRVYLFTFAVAIGVSVWVIHRNSTDVESSLETVGYLSLTLVFTAELVQRAVARRNQAEEERQRLQAQIQHAQKLESLGVLAGGIAHDFNNLLAGILGNASLALMELPPESPAQEKLKQIEEAGQRAAELCRQMLAYSGKGRFLVQALDLSKLVKEMAHLLEVSIIKKAVLEYNFPPSLPPIRGDSAQIQQVVMNLITNASEAIGDSSGVITVSTGATQCDRAYLSETYLDDNLPEGTYVYIEISDTGCGMDAETRAKIFDPFFSTKFVGRGLGLATVLGIVRGHKGALKVYSEPGRGTTFRVLFSCSEKPVEALAEGGKGVETWRGTGTILVVDDEESVRTVAQLILEKFGFRVMSAADGFEGVEVFRRHSEGIHAVLLDMTMPKMNGDEVFCEMRRIRADVPVILTSGYDEQETTDRFAGKGLAGFIQKPYRPADLVSKLRSVLESNRQNTTSVTLRGRTIL